MKKTEDLISDFEIDFVKKVQGTYPESVWLPVAEKDKAKDAVAADLLRDMAPSMAHIASDVLKPLITHALAEREEEIRERVKRLEYNLTEADLAHSTPLIRNGKTVIKGTRLTIQEIAEFLLSKENL